MTFVAPLRRRCATPASSRQHQLGPTGGHFPIAWGHHEPELRRLAPPNQPHLAALALISCGFVWGPCLRRSSAASSAVRRSAIRLRLAYRARRPMQPARTTVLPARAGFSLPANRRSARARAFLPACAAQRWTRWRHSGLEFAPSSTVVRRIPMVRRQWSLAKNDQSGVYLLMSLLSNNCSYTLCSFASQRRAKTNRSAASTPGPANGQNSCQNAPAICYSLSKSNKCPPACSTLPTLATLGRFSASFPPS